MPCTIALAHVSNIHHYRHSTHLRFELEMTPNTNTNKVFLTDDNGRTGVLCEIDTITRIPDPLGFSEYYSEVWVVTPGR